MVTVDFMYDKITQGGLDAMSWTAPVAARRDACYLYRRMRGMVAVLLFGVGCLAPRPIPSGDQDKPGTDTPAQPPPPLAEGFKLQLVPGKEAFVAGEPLRVRLVLTNTRKAQAQFVYRPGASHVRFTAVDEAGKPAACKPPRLARRIDPSRFVSVPAQSSIERDLDVARRCALTPRLYSALASPSRSRCARATPRP